MRAPGDLPPNVEPPSTPLHAPALHESGLRHTTGEARYVDDLPMPPGGLHGLVVTSPHPHARIVRRDATRARSVAGVHAVLLAEDVPGENDAGPVVHDEPLLAHDVVCCVGQSVALVVAETQQACRDAAAALVVEYQPLPALVDLRAAAVQGAFLFEPHVIRRGDVEGELARAEVRFTGEVHSGAQDHFYLETQVTLAVPLEGPSVQLYCSTQHPSEVQIIVARVLGFGRHQVDVEVPRMGGGFGGKETQAAPYAALAALAAVKTGRAVKVWLNRDQDMAQTGKRHPFWSQFEVGLDRDGTLRALKVSLVADGGYSADLTRAIVDRALFHVDNAYYLPAVELTGRAVRTNLPSNTAFRGFGGPQGMLVIEEILNRAAERLSLDPLEVRRRNFYGAAPRDTTPYGQTVSDCRLERLYGELLRSAEYERRREEVSRYNAAGGTLRRGLGFGFVKFGISFTTSYLNQAGALVQLYADGTVQLNHGGTEMGQGLHTKMLAVCAHELGIPVERIRAMPTSTGKVPNTSATAASSGSDLNGQAVAQACAVLRERLRPIAARLLNASDPAGVLFASGRAFLRGALEQSVELSRVVQAAYLAQVPLSATGFYRTPDIHYDRVAGRGKPFHYYAYGAAVVEVELSTLTGEHRMLRADLLHDVGDSLVPTIDLGQVEGGFIQGVGWLTCEEVLFDAQGRLLTHSPDTYKIPAVGDAPPIFRTELLSSAPQPDVLHGSKAVGEPPLMLGITYVTALRDALRSLAGPGREVALRIPCTPESVLLSCEALASP